MLPNPTRSMRRSSMIHDRYFASIPQPTKFTRRQLGKSRCAGKKSRDVKWNERTRKKLSAFFKHDPIYRVTSCTFMNAHRLEKRLSMNTQFTFSEVFVVVNLFFLKKKKKVGANDDWNLPKIENLCSTSGERRMAHFRSGWDTNFSLDS